MRLPSHPLSLNNIQLSHLINFSLRQLKQTNTFLQGEGARDKCCSRSEMTSHEYSSMNIF